MEAHVSVPGDEKALLGIPSIDALFGDKVHFLQVLVAVVTFAANDARIGGVVALSERVVEAFLAELCEAYEPLA